ncbi:TIGR03826 family flagellar region protein [Kyrpidia tusciae]|uniref:TIGR03826 family flagellar region protein n=1 Tax=Kyrpidia tusciae TaxID=33943 RepID=UPI00030B66D5|nr:TIGR03826 family flagellar region protein [Kyrpidia tusciae]
MRAGSEARARLRRGVSGVDFANCKRCGRIYRKVGREQICPACRREEEELYQKVREYVSEHRGATIMEVSEATGVDPDLVLQFLREGRLTVVSGENMRYPCERCGREITSGRFCDRCTAELARGLAPPKKEEDGKFHTRPGWTQRP